MKYIFRITAEGNPIQLIIGRDVLDIAVRISNYINSNFVASDFFTLGNTCHEAVTQFLEVLQTAQDDKVNLSFKRNQSDNFDRDQFNMLERVLWYGSNFGDDIPELEPFHDDIYSIYEDCFPK